MSRSRIVRLALALSLTGVLLVVGLLVWRDRRETPLPHTDVQKQDYPLGPPPPSYLSTPGPLLPENLDQVVPRGDASPMEPSPAESPRADN